MKIVQEKEGIEKALISAIRISGGIGELAREIGVSIPAIYSWMNGRRTPNRNNMQAIHAYINKKYSVYPTKERQSTLTVAEKHSRSSNKKNSRPRNARVYRDIELFDDTLEGTGKYYAFHSIWIEKVTEETDKLFLYKYEGEIMRPTLSSNVLILVNSAKKELMDSKLYMIMVDNILYVRRYFKVPEKLLFRVDNREYEFQDIDITEDQANFHIVGTIIWCGTEL